MQRNRGVEPDTETFDDLDAAPRRAPEPAPRASRGPADPGADLVTNPDQSLDSPSFIPPLALPDASVSADSSLDPEPRLLDSSWDGESSWEPDASLPPGGVGPAFSEELSLWPERSDLPEAAAEPRRPPFRRARPQEPDPSQPTSPSMPSVDLDRFAGAAGIAEPPPDHVRAAQAVAEEPSGGRPKVQLKFPTGRYKSQVTDTQRRRQMVRDPEADRTQEPPPPPRRVPAQFIAVAVIVAILNVPLLLVVWNGLDDTFGGDDALSMLEVAAIEAAIEADPARGEALLEKQGLDRDAWVRLLGEIAADETLSAELEAARAR